MSLARRSASPCALTTTVHPKRTAEQDNRLSLDPIMARHATASSYRGGSVIVIDCNCLLMTASTTAVR